MGQAHITKWPAQSGKAKRLPLLDQLDCYIAYSNPDFDNARMNRHAYRLLEELLGLFPCVAIKRIKGARFGLIPSTEMSVMLGITMLH